MTFQEKKFGQRGPKERSKANKGRGRRDERGPFLLHRSLPFPRNLRPQPPNTTRLPEGQKKKAEKKPKVPETFTSERERPRADQKK